MRHYRRAHLAGTLPAAAAGLPLEATSDIMAMLSSRGWQEKEICACRTPHLVWSHKHEALRCITFQAGVALEKAQRSGMNFPEHWLKTLKILLGFTMSH